MKVGELFDLRGSKMVWKTTVAAGKKPRTDLATVGISIGQSQSTGDTSRVRETLGDRAHHQAVANRRAQEMPRKFITVGQLKKAMADSSMTTADEIAICDELEGRKDDKVLSQFDIEQLAAIANVDLSDLKSVAGFY